MAKNGFDLNAYRDANRPWQFTAGSQTWIARHVSAPNCQRLDIMLEDAAGDPKKLRAAYLWILRRAFPWRPSYLVRGDPVTIILDRLEPAARREALKDFFECLLGMKLPTQPAPTKTNGTRSRARTASPTTSR